MLSYQSFPGLSAYNLCMLLQNNGREVCLFQRRALFPGDPEIFVALEVTSQERSLVQEALGMFLHLPRAEG